MNLSYQLLPVAWVYWLGGAYLTAVIVALLRLPWRRLHATPRLQHLFYGCSVGLMMLWWMRAGITPGLGVHFLGATAVTLILGWPLALLSTSLAALASAAVGFEPLALVPVDALLAGVVPVCVSQVVISVVQRRLPANPVVYILGGAFFGGVVAGLCARGAMVALVLASGTYSAAPILEESQVILLLMALPEGIVNGMVISLLVAYRPDWLESFDVRRYLGE